MVTDEKLLKISYDIDEFLMSEVLKHDISPITLSGIIMARLVRMNESAKTDNDFYELLNTVSAKDHLKPDMRTLQ